MNILYLLKILNTTKVSELVANIDAAPIDVNLAIWDSVSKGEIEIDEKKDKVKALKEHEITFDSDLAAKLLRVIEHYVSKEINVTRGRLNNSVKDTTSNIGYPYHDYLMALQYLVDSGQVIEDVVTVPEVKDKRPFHRFVFLCLPDNPNEEWNRREVNKWIANWEKKK